MKENISIDPMLIWTSPKNWRDQLPISVAVQERMRNEGRPKSIHKYRGYRLNMEQRRFRVYNDMCKYGDLATAMKRYSDPWYYRAIIPVESRTNPLPPTIPERFIWHVFRALVKANLFLERGRGRPDSRWKAIFHNDMGPQNVLLAQRPLQDDNDDNYTDESDKGEGVDQDRDNDREVVDTGKRIEEENDGSSGDSSGDINGGSSYDSDEEQPSVSSI